MEESEDCYVDVYVLLQRRRKNGEEKGGKYSEMENIFFLWDKKNREGKEGTYLEKISPQIVKDIKKSRFRSWSRDFCQFLEGFGIGLENLVSEKSLGFGFGKFGL